MAEQWVQQWIEWGVRRTWGDVGSVAFCGSDERTARNCAREWPGDLVHRVVTATAWADGEPQLAADLAAATEPVAAAAEGVQA